MSPAKEAAGEAAGLLAAFRACGAPVFHMRHVSTRLGATFFLPDNEGVKIHESVAPLASETVIVKHFPNRFRGFTARYDGQDLNGCVLSGHVGGVVDSPS